MDRNGQVKPSPIKRGIPTSDRPLPPLKEAEEIMHSEKIDMIEE